MIYKNNSVKDLKIAYIGGGSRGWAWTLMNDLAKTEDLSGTVYLYDIDYEAACHNETIGNKFPGNNWSYRAVKTAAEAMTGADFVIISILPGTFDEMESDVHAPEKYGIYQSVGDTAGPGGFIRALRTVPMMREIADNVRRYCPKAWVINYTNPMSVSIGALYREFPEIRAYGCCHEVFGTQDLLMNALEEMEGITGIRRQNIAVNVVGVNHFTWFTSAHYQNRDLFEVFRRFVDKFYESGYNKTGLGNWKNDFFSTDVRVRMDLFRRYGYVAAAGDRHLAEFMDFVSESIGKMMVLDMQLERLYSILAHMKEQALPKTRDEFESRAILYHVLMDMEDFLLIKKRFVDNLDEKYKGETFIK